MDDAVGVNRGSDWSKGMTQCLSYRLEYTVALSQSLAHFGLRRKEGAGSSDGSDKSDGSGRLLPRRLRASGGYRTLRSFQVTTVIYDATVSFCARFMDKRSRTVDQMVQAARSGRQNISEGSRASAISSRPS